MAGREGNRTAVCFAAWLRVAIPERDSRASVLRQYQTSHTGTCPSQYRALHADTARVGRCLRPYRASRLDTEVSTEHRILGTWKLGVPTKERCSASVVVWDSKYGPGRGIRTVSTGSLRAIRTVSTRPANTIRDVSTRPASSARRNGSMRRQTAGYTFDQRHIATPRDLIATPSHVSGCRRVHAARA
eukprot:1675699-Rhodomonas_salina.1